MHSIIVFSERCTLKNIEVKNPDIKVINRNDVSSVVSNIYKKVAENSLSEEDVLNIYDKLYPCTQNSEEIKMQHIANIQNNLAKKSPVLSEITGVVTKEEEVESCAENVISEQSADISVEVENKVKEPEKYKCPRCDGNLVLRTASRGENAGNQFWGCANYPKCRYIRNVNK